MESIGILDKVKGEFIMSLLPKKKGTPLPMKIVVTSEKVTVSFWDSNLSRYDHGKNLPR